MCSQIVLAKPIDIGRAAAGLPQRPVAWSTCTGAVADRPIERFDHARYRYGLALSAGCL